MPEDIRRGRRQRSDALTLETDRLVLRPIATDDADALHRISNEPAVRRYLWDNGPVQKATIWDIVSESSTMFADEGVGLFGVRRRGRENLIGFCGFVRLEGMEEPELAYELTQGTWGEGIATEVSLVCLHHAFEEAALERVIAGADPGNVASQRVIEKLGMVNSGPGFARQPNVVNGFSDLILELYGPDAGDHARSAVGMAELPLGVPVE
jgi:RimJ/RimL family protein N-acetyltransferase